MMFPQTFSTASQAAGEHAYHDPAILKLIQFFEAKGLAALKEEDRLEKWCDDWIAYQAEHRLYAQFFRRPGIQRGAESSTSCAMLGSSKSSGISARHMDTACRSPSWGSAQS